MTMVLRRTCPAATCRRAVAVLGVLFAVLAATVAAVTVPSDPAGAAPPDYTVGIAATPDGDGYWLVNGRGRVTPLGTAASYGDARDLPLNQPVVGIVATATGRGYWLVAADGGTFAYGDAPFHGSTGSMRLNRPVVSLAPTPTGRGYWLVASDGGIFAFGDAPFLGSMGGRSLNRPVIGMVASATGLGYRMVASDGGVFAYGDAPFLGSLGGAPPASPIVGLAPARSGGYWLATAAGQVVRFGAAPDLGSLTNPAAAVVGIAGNPTADGYRLALANGATVGFGDAPGPDVAASTAPVPFAGAPGCPALPADNVWNRRVTDLPVRSGSPATIAFVGAGTALKADFGSGLWNGGPIGIPFTTVSGSQARVPVSFLYASESDPGPYPVPADAPVEGGPASSGDRHVLVVDRDACRLYELYDARPQGGGASWTAGSGAVFDLRSNALRPAGWTSADAAGLPILPGLVRYEEVAAGEIRHAIRVTVPRTARSYVWPARHQAGSSTSPDAPPMGLRLRVKASVDASSFPPQAAVVVRALQTYGMVVADNGSAWYLSGAPDERWDNDQLRALGRLTGADLEVVDTAGLVVDPNSGRAG